MALRIPYQIEPQAADGTLIKSKYIKGTLTVVSDLTERAALPSGTQVNGSLCYVASESKFYTWNGSAWEESIYTRSQMDQLLAAKQATLIGTQTTGQNLKTVNGETLLGSGNIEISGGSYTAGSGIDITDNVISVNDTIATTANLTAETSARMAADTVLTNGLNTEAATRENADNVLSTAIGTKQAKLTAGTNITIDSNNVISATGGGSLIFEEDTTPTADDAVADESILDE